MKSIVLISVICLQFCWSYGKPEGVGAVAYQDTHGNSRRFAWFPPLPPLPPLLPLQPLMPPLMPPLLPPLLNTRFPAFPAFPPFPMFGSNSAFAGAAAGPGFTQQIANIDPANPGMPNVNIINRFAETGPNTGSNYKMVSTSSYSSSSNINGKEVNQRGATTMVDDNGKVTSYRVYS